MRTYSGHPSSNIRFSTSAAMASLAYRSSVCERSPSPMTRFQREISHSTRARQLSRGLLPAHAPTLGDTSEMRIALRRRDLRGLARHRIRARWHDHGRSGMAGRNLGVDVVAVIGAVAGDGCHYPLDPVEQGTDLGAIVGILVGQHR